MYIHTVTQLSFIDTNTSVVIIIIVIIIIIIAVFIVIFFKGAEFEVLKQVPWEKVDVEVLMVELAHAGKVPRQCS